MVNQFLSSTSSGLLSSIAMYRPCWKRTSRTSLCHIPKWPVPSKTSTVNLAFIKTRLAQLGDVGSTDVEGSNLIATTEHTKNNLGSDTTTQVELQGLEEYQDIVKAVSQLLFYKSHEELIELLFRGFHINNQNTWFSLNANGEHCEMLSIAHCLISGEGGLHHTDIYSRFPRFSKTNKKGFKVHIRPQFMTPLIDYTVNLVFCKDRHSEKQNNGRTFDLEIVFEDHKDNLQVEGVLFQPLEKVQHEQVLEDEKLSNDSLQWTMKKDLFSKLFKKSKGQKGYAVDNNGKKYLMFSAKGTIISDKLSFFKPSPESRFQEVAVITASNFNIVKEIKCDALTPETTYACFLVYKSTNDQPVLKIIHPEYRYIYLVSPPETPIIGQKLDQNTRNALNRPKLDYVPRQRSDGWMEVKVLEFQDPRYTKTIEIDIWLRTPDFKNISGLIIESIELRPIVAHLA
ncbi:protein kinase-like domain, Phloem protein 2-like protein [Artemisia annua]|uniref:Protein kinase-like domain, Phloem protein 2-like protein n=1 Tax=Artemisia annua TaxID=35608 RepID=A0A2U1MQV4_ARTAN|nr:protein kinase-like domain, Phloem protein 2-like protein [Artemisia annua]